MPTRAKARRDHLGDVLRRRHRELLVARRRGVEPDLAVERHHHARAGPAQRRDAVQHLSTGQHDSFEQPAPRQHNVHVVGTVLQLDRQRLDRRVHEQQVRASALRRLARRRGRALTHVLGQRVDADHQAPRIGGREVIREATVARPDIDRGARVSRLHLGEGSGVERRGSTLADHLRQEHQSVLLPAERQHPFVRLIAPDAGHDAECLGNRRRGHALFQQ